MSDDESIEPKTGVAPMRWAYVFVIGLGIFTTAVSWDVYDSYLPAAFLADFISGEFALTIIGAIMVVDNLFALFMQPSIGARSDKTRTKWGRRMPYIMLGTPIAALFFTLIAVGWAAFNFIFMMAAITLFNVFMAVYRAPVVALMPDVVPSEHRSKANGVINLMGGIGAIYAFAVTSQIYRIQDPGLAAIFGVAPAQVGPLLTFLTTSIIMIVAVLIMFGVVKEPPAPSEDISRPTEIGAITAVRQVASAEDKSALAILGAVFLWFFGYHAMKTWFTTYGVNVWSFTVDQATFMLTPLALMFVLFAVPAGYIANKLTRRKTILLGLVGFMICLGTLTFLSDYTTLLIVLAIAGIFWAMVNVNSIVIVWEVMGKSRLGVATGIYYLFQHAAAISGPFLAGLFFDLTDISLMFPLAIVFMLLAFIVTSLIKVGEVGDESVSEVAK